MNVTLDEILRATGGRLITSAGPDRFTAITTDTRSMLPGSLYVPLKGAKFDGHAFVADAVKSGATGLLIAREDVVPPTGVSAVRVEDTRAAYGDLARHYREALGLKIVAVTGSSGKTSTKELIAAVLERFLKVAKSHGNFNNEIGVPRTLLDLSREDEACVLEMGMRGPGEIAYLASVARPDIGVITNVGTAHIGRLGTQEAIARAKGELLRVGGPTMAAVLNLDDPFVMGQAAEHLGPVATFSLHDPEATVWADGEDRTFRAHWKARDGVPAGSCLVTMPLPGEHHRANALAAIAVAWFLGFTLPPEVTLEPPELPGRARILKLGEIEVVDETYNANPESVRATLRGFKADACAGRRIAVLGEMGELGTYSEVAHRSVGTLAKELELDRVLCVGPMARWTAEAAGDRAVAVTDNAEALAVLLEELKPGDRVFVKGSRAAGMEAIVAGLEARLGGPTA